MSLAPVRAGAWPTAVPFRSVARPAPGAIGLAALAAFAVAVRLAMADQQSAYMDEGTNVLTGRLLVERHAVYAEILNWAYGSYLWPLVAGLADTWGGLRMVRAVTAVCGLLMVLATALAAARLAPAAVPGTRRWGVALLGGAIMAVAPTAVGVARFGTYDALAGAGFMLGTSLLLPLGAAHRRRTLLAAAALLFVAFLAKYLVAIFFPFVCLALVVGTARQPGVALHHILWFVLPLFAACVGYLLVFLGPLLTLLGSSLHYADLRSADPLHEYVWTRSELCLLVGAAALGWRRARWPARLVAPGGTAMITGFQIAARPDFDFWKHSIYVVYFLAPLAALTWLAIPHNTGTWRVVSSMGLALGAGWAAQPSIGEASRVINFYPNLNPSLAAIESYTAGSALVLTDDTALRYYLYPAMDTDRVIGPFAFTYHGLDGLDAYRSAIADGYFDAIVLDGGVSPQGNAIHEQLAQTIDRGYTQVYSGDAGHGFSVAIYKPISPSRHPDAIDADGSWPVAYHFDAGLDGWGGHPETGDWQPGLQVETSTEHSWEDRPSLRFAVTEATSLLSLERAGPVRRLRAHLYLVPGDGGSSPVRVGFVAFDDAWQWHDDGFRWLVAPNTWTSITWELPQPGQYHELGLKFPANVAQVYVGAFEIVP